MTVFGLEDFDIPAPLRFFVMALPTYLGIKREQLFVSDTGNAFAIACEIGPTDWTSVIVKAICNEQLPDPAGWFIEPHNMWTLAAHRKGSQ